MSTVLNNYLNLIPAPNRLQPNFIETLTALFQPYVDIQTALGTFATNFNIKTAIGTQLDTLGQLIGLSRTVTFQPSDGSSPVLSDSNYQIALLAKVIQNQWKGTTQEIYDFWTLHFPNNPLIIKDNQNMTMDVLVVGMAPGIQQDLVKNFYFMPKPAGVLINFSFTNQLVYSYDLENTVFAGYDQGYWVTVS